MKPTYDNVFVVQVEKKTQTASGIILTGDTESGLKPGKVVATGPDVKTVVAGDEVYLKWNEATPITHMGEQGALVSEKFIMAVL